MKVMTSLLAVLVLAWAAPVRAAPLKMENVSADANWVVHFNVDAMRSSTVVQKVFHQCIKPNPRAEKCFEKIHKKWGIDVHKDLHGLTAYGPKFGRHQMVLIVFSHVNKDVLLCRAKEALDHKTVKYGKYEIHTWTDAKGTKYAHQAAGAFYAPDELVFASGIDLEKKALDVLDHKAPSLAGKKTPLAEKVPEGALVVIRAVGVDKSKRAHKLAVLSVIKQFSYVKGEHKGQWFAHLAVTADSDQAAAQLRDILQGVRAFVSLHARAHPEVVKLLSRVAIKAKGKTVQANLAAKAAEVAAVAPVVCKAVLEHIERHVAMHMHAGKCGPPAKCPCCEKCKCCEKCECCEKCPCRAKSSCGAKPEHAEKCPLGQKKK